MKKMFFGLCMFLSVNMFAQSVATFEEAAISPAEDDTIYVLEESGQWQSGPFTFDQEVADYGEYGTYYYGFVVSNQTDTAYSYYADAYNAACGHAYEGENYAVWYGSYMGLDRVSMTEPTLLDYCYLTNTTWVVSSITEGDAIAGEPFAEGDWLRLTIYGLLGTDTVGTVDYMLAEDEVYTYDWERVELSELGEVDGLAFAITGSRTGDYGLNNPGYFCMDNLTAKTETALEETEQTLPATLKRISRNGLVIVHNNQLYNAQGQSIR